LHFVPVCTSLQFGIRDAQRIVEAIETLVRMYTAQEEDIDEAVSARTSV